MSDVISVKALKKYYGDDKNICRALNGVDLNVGQGDYICIMGPSGSGKSTLLNVISTLDVPTRGIVKFNGKSLNEMTENEISKFRYENMGFIFQEFNLIDTLTIRENIEIPLVLAGKKKREINERVEKIAKRLAIESILDKFPSECSGGQRQRAASARALITEPKLIIADEPTGNLDSKNSHELLKILKELNEEEGITIIMVTHDSLIASYAKSLIFLKDGKVNEVISREGRSQKEFFYNIIEVTSKESQILFDMAN